jgi:long-chain fatty acid transport protein
MHHQSRKLIALALATMAPSVWASGFALQNQNGSGNGNAFAGAAAAAEDAGTIFFNPAGMTLLGAGHNVSLAGTVIDRSIKFTDTGSTADPTALGTIAPLVATGNGGDAGGTSLVPAGYWAYALSNQLWVGLGISPTFGNTTEYDFNFIGRNAGYYADMMQININPSVAYKLNEVVSLGFGLNFAYNETHFKQGYPITAAPNVAACPPLPTCAALNSADNYVDIKGDAWATGYNLGAMFNLSPSTRLALTYRSQLKFELEGKYDVKTPVAGGAVFGDQNVKGVLKTPDSSSLAVSQRLSDRLELLADATWTGWSVINNIDLKSQATGALVARLSYNFKDTWRYGIGANYAMNDAWKLRFGVAYDETPVKSPADRTMTLPDSDRTWLSLGARYALSKESSIDMGYTHLFFKDASTARAVTTSLGTVQTIRGNFKTSADLFSLQYNQKF